MTFYIHEKKSNKPIFEFKVHSIDIYPKYLDDDFDFSDNYNEIDIINKISGEVVLTLKDSTMTYIDNDYNLILEDA